MKAVKIDLAGREQYLMLTVEGMFQIDDAFGGSAGLIDGSLKCHLIKSEEHLSLAHVLTFINMNLCDESCYLRTDINVGLTLYGCREGRLQSSCLRSDCDSSDFGGPASASAAGSSNMKAAKPRLRASYRCRFSITRWISLLFFSLLIYTYFLLYS